MQRKKVIESTHCVFGCTVRPITTAFCAPDFTSLESPGPALQRNPSNSKICKIARKINNRIEEC